VSNLMKRTEYLIFPFNRKLLQSMTHTQNRAWCWAGQLFKDTGSGILYG
jgi:hypothetical protein